VCHWGGMKRKENSREKNSKIVARMGASSSTEQKVSREQREAESLAASTGALPMLQKSFSRLADPQTNAVPIKKLARKKLENCSENGSVEFDRAEGFEGTTRGRIPSGLHGSSSYATEIFLQTRRSSNKCSPHQNLTGTQ
jgi:hypothetical protein